MTQGQGRRGPGEFILGTAEDKPDFSEPLAPVAAYGAIETDSGTISITLREPLHGQISVETVCQSHEEIPVQYREVRRWTYSTWHPGDPCPQCLRPAREVPMKTISAALSHAVLAFCGADKRIWIHTGSEGMNRLIPVTNYYNELMLHKNVRDPGTALDATNLFRNLSSFSDNDLAYAFLNYNSIRTKIRTERNPGIGGEKPPGIGMKVKKLFRLKA